MSTNSRLRMVLPSGRAAKPIYCHYDGYPSYMLPILREHYNTIEKVEELLALGDLSLLDVRVKPYPDEAHDFDNPALGVTIAYHRDRGEDLVFTSSRQEYNYIFNGETWEIEQLT